jgi:hypothetical protein
MNFLYPTQGELPMNDDDLFLEDPCSIITELPEEG